jgi:Sulfotransferase domain
VRRGDTDPGRTRKAEGSRFPDFIIIGAAKSGTTSLFKWLSEQPEIWVPGLKEPDFFSHDRIWSRGPEWYGTVFAGAGRSLLCGEASTSYTEIKYAARTAPRMAETIPDVKLIYVLRHPLERLRSHYRHETQRGRERRPLADAVAEVENEYVGSSLYFTCLEPYVSSFSRDQICVVRFEDLVTPPPIGWSAILDHLGLPQRPLPGGVYNRTADKPGYGRTLMRLSELGVLRGTRHLPGPVRRLGKTVFTRRRSDYALQLEQSRMPLPDAVERRIWTDVLRLEAWLGAESPLWQRDAA